MYNFEQNFYFLSLLKQIKTKISKISDTKKFLRFFPFYSRMGKIIVVFGKIIVEKKTTMIFNYDFFFPFLRRRKRRKKLINNSLTE